MKKLNRIKGNLILTNSQAKSLKGCPDYVGGFVSITDTKIEDLDCLPKYIGGNFYCINTPLAGKYMDRANKELIEEEGEEEEFTQKDIYELAKDNLYFDIRDVCDLKGIVFF